MRTTLRKKIVFIALLGFCLLQLLDWLGVTRGGFPSNWTEALIQALVNIGWTVFFTAVSYFVLMRPLRRPSGPSEEDGTHAPAQAKDQQQGKSDHRNNAER
jgi:hypothetical protein